MDRTERTVIACAAVLAIASAVLMLSAAIAAGQDYAQGPEDIRFLLRENERLERNLEHLQDAVANGWRVDGEHEARTNERLGVAEKTLEVHDRIIVGTFLAFIVNAMLSGLSFRQIRQMRNGNATR